MVEREWFYIVFKGDFTKIYRVSGHSTPRWLHFFVKVNHHPKWNCRPWGLGRSPGSPKVTSTCEHRCQIEPPGRINPIVLPSSMGTSGPSPLSERSVDSI